MGRTRLAYEDVEPGGCTERCPPFRSRLLLIDPETGAIRYESADLDRSTAVEGPVTAR